MDGFLGVFQSILKFCLNIIESVAIVISIVTFFVLMINKYSEACR